MLCAASRGHAIFLVSLVQRDSQTFRTSESQLYLVDLAGSEKVSKTEVRGTQLREASHINRSLLALVRPLVGARARLTPTA